MGWQPPPPSSGHLWAGPGTPGCPAVPPQLEETGGGCWRSETPPKWTVERTTPHPSRNIRAPGEPTPSEEHRPVNRTSVLNTQAWTGGQTALAIHRRIWGWRARATCRWRTHRPLCKSHIDPSKDTRGGPTPAGSHQSAEQVRLMEEDSEAPRVSHIQRAHAEGVPRPAATHRAVCDTNAGRPSRPSPLDSRPVARAGPEHNQAYTRTSNPAPPAHPKGLHKRSTRTSANFLRDGMDKRNSV